MVKKICLLLCALSVLFFMPAAAENTRVFDQANLLEGYTEKLEEVIDGLIEETQLDVVIVTTDDAEGKTAMEYADDFYDYNGFGIGSEYDGLLFLIDMDNREVWISTCGKAINIFTDARIDRMTDTSLTYLSEADYMGAAEAFLDDVQYYTSLAESTEDYESDLEEYLNSETDVWEELLPTFELPSRKTIVFFLGIALAAGGIFCLIVRSRYKAPKYTQNYPYAARGTLDLTLQEDVLVNQYTTHHRISTSSGSSSRSGSRSSGGRSSTHRSSSGRRHGGGGKRF